VEGIEPVGISKADNGEGLILASSVSFQANTVVFGRISANTEVIPPAILS
jgi:hypothetical protein